MNLAFAYIGDQLLIFDIERSSLLDTLKEITLNPRYSYKHHQTHAAESIGNNVSTPWLMFPTEIELCNKLMSSCLLQWELFLTSEVCIGYIVCLHYECTTKMVDVPGAKEMNNSDHLILVRWVALLHYTQLFTLKYNKVPLLKKYFTDSFVWSISMDFEWATEVGNIKNWLCGDPIF